MVGTGHNILQVGCKIDHGMIVMVVNECSTFRCIDEENGTKTTQMNVTGWILLADQLLLQSSSLLSFWSPDCLVSDFNCVTKHSEDPLSLQQWRIGARLGSIVDNMYILGVDKNVTAMFRKTGHLWGVMHSAPLGVLMRFMQCPRLTANTTPYHVFTGISTPGSIVVRYLIEVAMHFVIQLYMLPWLLACRTGGLTTIVSRTVS
ncbi:hypothetical protein F5146DRAFT_1006763 [Armillaria mellea]|nr:hypothetical protein F5146DRAFT_1006763 [Armillaria mellea]